MADAAASLKLTLESSGFTRGLKDAEGAAGRSATKMGASIKGAMERAAKGGLSALGGMFSALKSGFGMLTGLGGGIGLGMLVKSALDAEGAFRRLAFAVQGATGKPADVAALRAQLQGLAVDTGISVDELTATFGDLLTRTGDLKFVQSSMTSITDATLATGASFESLNAILEAAHDQFGITGAQSGDVLAQMTALASTSGMSVDELASKFELVSATATAAGLAGTEGLSQTAAMLKVANDAFGGLRQGVAAYTAVMNKLGSQAGRKDVFMKLGVHVDPSKGNALDAMREVLKKTGGKKEALEVAFGAGSTEVRFLAQAGKSYAATFEATAGDVKAKTAAGIAAFDAAIKEAGTSERKAADVAAEAAKAKQEAERQVASAIEQLKVAFTQPEIIAAMGTLARQLPPLASAMSSAIPMLVENVKMLPAAVTSAVFAKGALSSVLSSATGGIGGLGNSALTTGGQLTSFGKSLGGAAVATAAFAAAALAVSAAAQQAAKLFDELDQRDKDTGDERENLLRQEEKQGKDFAIREKSSWEQIRGGSKFEKLTRNKQTGEIESAPMGGLGTLDEQYALESRRHKATRGGHGGATAAAAPAMTPVAPVAGGYAAASAGPKGPAAADVGRSFAGELVGRTLKVTVDPASIAALAAANKAGPPGPPKPGSADR